MLRTFGTLILAVSLMGCGGKPGNDSGESEKNQSAQGGQKRSSSHDAKSNGGSRVDSMATAGSNIGDANKFKHLGIAMQNHHVVFSQFPTIPNKLAKDRKLHENLSWRVALLPFVELADEYKCLMLLSHGIPIPTNPLPMDREKINSN